MVLLQVVMVAEFLLVICLCVFLIVLTPPLTGLLMKAYWRSIDKKQNIADNKLYYKEPIPFLISVVISIVALLGAFYLLLILLQIIFPDLFF